MGNKQTRARDSTNESPPEKCQGPDVPAAKSISRLQGNLDFFLKLSFFVPLWQTKPNTFNSYIERAIVYRWILHSFF